MREEVLRQVAMVMADRIVILPWRPLLSGKAIGKGSKIFLDLIVLNQVLRLGEQGDGS